MLGAVKQLLGEAYLHQSRLNYKAAGKGDIFQWHQDYASWVHDGIPHGGHRDMLTVLITLDDSTPDNGPLLFVPGSHKHGLIDAFYDTTTTSYPLHIVPDEYMDKHFSQTPIYECVLLPINQISMQFYNRVNYHDYEGISLDLDERSRIAASMKDANYMILRNHGLLTTGRSVAEAFTRMFYLNRACEIQMKTLSMGQKITVPSPEVCEHAAKQHDDYANLDTLHLDREWTALLRLLDRDGGDYRS